MDRKKYFCLIGAAALWCGSIYGSASSEPDDLGIDESMIDDMHERLATLQEAANAADCALSQTQDQCEISASAASAAKVELKIIEERTDLLHRYYSRRSNFINRSDNQNKSLVGKINAKPRRQIPHDASLQNETGQGGDCE